MKLLNFICHILDNLLFWLVLVFVIAVVVVTFKFGFYSILINAIIATGILRHFFSLGKKILYKKIAAVKEKTIINDQYMPLKDGLLQKISWISDRHNYNHERQRQLIKVEPGKYVLRKSMTINIIDFIGITLVILLFISQTAPWIADAGIGAWAFNNPFMVIYNTIIVVIYFFILRQVILCSHLDKIVFDLNNEYLLEIRGCEKILPKINGRINKININNIAALQTINSYRERDNDGHEGYYTYELNLVFNDGKRLSLMSNTDEIAFYTDAIKLSEILTVPILNLTNPLYGIYDY